MAIRNVQSHWKLSYSKERIVLAHPNGTWEVQWSAFLGSYDMIDTKTGEIKWTSRKDIRCPTKALEAMLKELQA